MKSSHSFKAQNSSIKINNKIQIKNLKWQREFQTKKIKCQNEPINNKLQNAKKKKKKKKKNINPVGENINQNLHQF